MEQSRPSPIVTEFAAWVQANLAVLRAEYESQLDAGEWIDWTTWLINRWLREQLPDRAAA